MSKASDNVLAERQRQIDVEGWTPEHDDEHFYKELARAAATLALYGAAGFEQGNPPQMWPFEDEAWKPKSYRENLVRAGALIIAEIERLDRMEST